MQCAANFMPSITWLSSWMIFRMQKKSVLFAIFTFEFMTSTGKMTFRIESGVSSDGVSWVMSTKNQF